MRLVRIFLCICAWAISVTTAEKHSCSSLPELYYANVAGRITGGVDVMRVGDQTPCSQLSLVDRRYRQIDGRCNHPLDYGMTFKPVKRYLRSHYQDRLNHPRVLSVRRTLLPSPRLVSWKLNPDMPAKDKTSVMFMQFGQFLDHDITSAPVPTRENVSIKCCTVPANRLPAECFPIRIPLDDPDFDTCMEFVRSEAAKNKNGKQIYPREQMNALTSFVDASAVYGSSEDILQRIRSQGGKGALLNTRFVNGKERLPKDEEAPSNECVEGGTEESYCQLAGDLRVNEQPGLGAIHLAFHKYHNHLVKQLVIGILKKRRSPTNWLIVNQFIRRAPSYLKEKLFQEARKILGGIMQKIVYCDFLPIVLGPRLIQKFKLGCKEKSTYNKLVDPRVANSFLAAAYRFGHSLIPNKLSFDGGKHDLKDMFMIPDINLKYYESIMQGLLKDGENEAFDRFISKSVSRHLFESSKGPTGRLDLVAINIQRGRDHGIPGYYFWRRYYGLRQVTRLTQIGKSGDLMQNVYRHVLDIDLFTGGVMETPVVGGMVGPTFGHIIANQFADLKYGDAYFFLSEEFPQGFTPDQVKVIKDTSLATILCTSTDMGNIQKNPFLLKSSTNPVKQCSKFSTFDVKPWMKYF